MRLYEISKEINRSNKEVVDFLKANGFPISGHMAVLSDQAIAFIKLYPALTVPVKNTSPATPTKQELSKKPFTFKADNNVVADSVASLVTPKDNSIPSSEQQLLVDTGTSLGQLSLLLHRSVSELILALLKKKIICTKNQLLNDTMLQALSQIYDFGIKPAQSSTEKTNKVHIVSGITHRNPVVVIIGHVDHGKTTLLDYIRNTKVAIKEKGGITQHLGAYEAQTSKGTIVFLDTPGHEAFSKMRSRGVRIADIAILLVAADDGVKPQTIEAIKHAQQADIPIIVALNKIDKATAQQIEAAKRGLMQYHLTPEEWGGQTIMVPISAKEGKGVDQLLDILSLQAEIMELKSSPDGAAKGFVLEARMQKGFGPVATIIGQQGTIKIGDYFITPSTSGRVNAIIDSQGKKVDQAEPSVPVSVAGFEALPQSGDIFEVITHNDYKKNRSNNKPLQQSAPFGEYDQEKSINILIKADNNSSKEAIISAIESFGKKNMSHINIVYSGVGDINESNVALAQTTKALIYGFNTKAEAKVSTYAQGLGITICCFDVIYHLIDDIVKRATLAPEIKYAATKVGEATVICTFKIKFLGLVAGIRVIDGKIVKDAKVIVKRGKYKIAEGTIKSLEREKRSVKEVANGFECAISIEGFDDWQIDDRIECIASIIVKN